MTDTADTKKETVTVTIDGKEVEAISGEYIINAAERSGVYVPRFCYHPRLKSVSMCRMCLVEVDGPRGPALVPSCFVPVAEGQNVSTNSERVKKAQDGVLEFLLVNHPLDCPVCDKGGECPLQDQTLAYGPGETRFVEEKRHWEKPIALSDLVLLDRERCIQCSRCTRFADEVAGDPLIEFINRGERTEVNTFPGEPFASYFSGNTVQICPVGALTATPYRFKARPWDLEQVESTCTGCSVGCRITVQSSANKLVRYLGVDADSVNHEWLCDKGRFSFEAINSESRLRSPMLRKDDDQIEVSWSEALEEVKTAVASTKPESIAFLGGARLSNEDALAWVSLAKGVIGTDNVDCQLGDGLPADLVLGLPNATINETCSAEQIVLLCPDLKEELPVLYLRVREAAVDKNVPLIEIAPRRSGLSRYATSTHLYNPGDVSVVVQKLIEDGTIKPNAVVILGRPSLAETEESISHAAKALTTVSGVRFLMALRRANVRGALEAGMAPGLLPGRMTFENKSSGVSEWPKAPAAKGLDATGILRAAADGEIKVLFLLGTDPLANFPDAELAKRALEKVRCVVSVDTHPSESVLKSSVVLPAAAFAEKDGTTTNLEGRVTHMSQKITPPGVAWADWMIASEISAAIGSDLGFANIPEITSWLAVNAPSYAPLSNSKLTREGVVLEHPQGAVTFNAPADRAHPHRFDQYALRLITSRTLYDHGTLVEASPSSIALASDLRFHINPADLDRLGVKSGEKLKVRGENISATEVSVVGDSGVPKGCAWVPFAVDFKGISASSFITAGNDVNDIQVEAP